MFGAELLETANGLSNSDIEYCDYIVNFDTELFNNSMSLPTAVCVALYEIKRYMSSLKYSSKEKKGFTELQLSSLSNNIREFLKSSGFIGNTEAKWAMPRINRMLEQLEDKDLDFLYAILRRLEDGK